MKNKDLAFHVNSTWLIDCDVSDPSGNPAIIATAEWRLASPTSRLILVTNLDGGIVITGPGQCTINVPLNKQNAVPAGVYDHELWIIDSNGDASVAIAGKFNLVESLKRKYP